jgi:hypothetical protein
MPPLRPLACRLVLIASLLSGFNGHAQTLSRQSLDGEWQFHQVVSGDTTSQASTVAVLTRMVVMPRALPSQYSNRVIPPSSDKEPILSSNSARVHSFPQSCIRSALHPSLNHTVMLFARTLRCHDARLRTDRSAGSPINDSSRQSDLHVSECLCGFRRFAVYWNKKLSCDGLRVPFNHVACARTASK